MVRADRCRVVEMAFLCGCLPVLLLLFMTVAPATCRAADLPSVAELRKNFAALRAASSNVQGEIRVYRSETVKPEALDRLPSDIELPLILSGTLWRSQDRFRADYKTLRPKQLALDLQESVAVDGGKLYQLSGGPNPEGGMLRVSSLDTTEASAAMATVRHRFFEPLDALWSLDGVPLEDLLQRPDTTIQPSQMFPGNFSFDIAAEDGTKERLEFASTTNSPLAYVFATQAGARFRVTVQRRIVSVEKHGALYPRQVVSVVDLGKDGAGYTEVALLDLEPLKVSSPIAAPVDAGSFRDLKIGYQVYNVPRSGEEDLGERYGTPDAVPGNSPTSFRTFFLWLNGFAIMLALTLVLYGFYRKLTAKRPH